MKATYYQRVKARQHDQDYSGVMQGLSSLRACAQGHVIHYPQVLDAKAMQEGRELAFCSTCECSTVHFVVVWADGARVMASGNAGLFEKFEGLEWPEETHADDNGVFEYRTVPHPLDVSLFLKD